MKKSYRVKTDKDFQKVYRHGESVANRQLVLYVYPKADQKHFRVGLSVGKKIGNAVVRNRIKRLIRAALQELKPAINPEIDFLLIARRDIIDKDFHQIKNSIIHVMNIAGIIDESKINTRGGTDGNQE